MAKYIEREMNDIDGSGKKRSYYQFDTYRNLSEDSFIEQVRFFNPSVSPGMVKSMLYALSSTMAKMMGLGYSVTLDGIGTFKPKLGLEEGKNSLIPQEHIDNNYVPAPSVININFKAAKELINDTNVHATIERGGTRKRREQKYTEAERLDMAKTYLKANTYMRLKDYMALTGLSHSSASRELRKFTADTTSGIKRNGVGSHLIYILRDMK